MHLLKAKTIAVILMILALSLVYFYYQSQNKYMGASLLIRENGGLFSEAEMKKLPDEYTCYRYYDIEELGCEETRHGKTCKNNSKITDKYICNLQVEQVNQITGTNTEDPFYQKK